MWDVGVSIVTPSGGKVNDSLNADGSHLTTEKSIQTGLFDNPNDPGYNGPEERNLGNAT
jgi:hypothetical protein